MIETTAFKLLNGGEVIVEYDYEKCSECGQPKVIIKIGATKAIIEKLGEKKKPKYKIERITDMEQIKQNIKNACKED